MSDKKGKKRLETWQELEDHFMRIAEYHNERLYFAEEVIKACAARDGELVLQHIQDMTALHPPEPAYVGIAGEAESDSDDAGIPLTAADKKYAN